MGQPVTVEELQIVISAKLDQTLQTVGERLQKIFADAMPKINQQLSATMQGMQEPLARAQQKVQAASTAASQAVQLSVSASKKSMGDLSAELGNLNARLENQRKIYESLIEKSRAVSLSEGDNGPKGLRIEKQMLIAESMYDRLQKKADAVKAAMASIQEPVNKTAQTIQRVKESTEKATKSARKYGESASSAAQKASSAFSKLGDIIKNALIIGSLYKGFRALFSFISNGIQGAIAAPETENLFRVALKGMADDGAAFADQMKRSLGVDQFQTKQMVGTFQNITTSMGIGSQTAYKMSKSLTILANDMASLYNVPVDQAFENLQSALEGQGRAVLKYGYVVNETQVKQAAWRHGLVAVGQELTEQEKVIARYYALLDQSTNAQGDMARTLESLQNQLRVLQGNITAAGRSIGEAFIPFIQAVVPLLNAFFIVLERVGNALARFTYGLFGMDYDAEKKKQEQIAGGLGDIADAEEAVGDAAEEAGKKAEGSLASFDKLNVIQKGQGGKAQVGASGGIEVPGLTQLDIPDTVSPFEKMADHAIKAFKDAFAKLQGFWDAYFSKPFAEAWEKIKPQVAAIGQTFRAIGQDILSLAEPMKAVFYSSIIPVLQQLVTTSGDILAGLLESANMVISNIWGELYPMIYSFIELGIPVIAEFVTQAILTFGTLFEAVKSVFDSIWSDAVTPALHLVSQIWQDLMADLKDFWDKWGEPTFENVRKTIDTVQEVFLSLWNNVLSPVFEHIFEVLMALWEEHLRPLVQQIGDFVGTFINAALDIFNYFIKPLSSWFEVLGPMITAIINTIVSYLFILLSSAADIASGVIKYFQGLVEFIAGWFTNDWDRAWNGIKTSLSAIWDGIVSIVRRGVDIIGNIIDGVMETITSVIDKGKELLGLGGSKKTRTRNIDYPSDERSGYRMANIPQLAGGAVLTRPTLANLAEYAGASGNPEIVSPQSTIYDTVVEANAPLVSALTAKLDQKIDQLISVVRKINPTFQIGDDIVFASAKRGAARYEYMTGEAAY